MSYRWLLIATVVQTAMFIVLILFVARLEDRITARLAAVEVALIDLREHIAPGK